MATFRLKKRPSSALVVMVFGSYNEAITFCKASALLNPSRPYKHGLDWKVSIVKPFIEKAEYEKLPHWKAPGAYYNEWRSLEPLYHLPVGETKQPAKLAS